MSEPETAQNWQWTGNGAVFMLIYGLYWGQIIKKAKGEYHAIFGTICRMDKLNNYPIISTERDWIMSSAHRTFDEAEDFCKLHMGYKKQ